MADNTEYDRTLTRLKNNKWVVWPLIAFLVLLGIGQFWGVWKDLLPRDDQPTDNDLGLSAVPVLPDAFEFPFSVEVQTQRYPLPDVNAKCELGDWVGEIVKGRGNDISGFTDRFARLRPGQTFHIKCNHPIAMEHGHRLKSANVAIDLDFSIENRPGRYFARWEFKLTTDRLGKATWEMTRKLSGDAPSRPKG